MVPTLPPRLAPWAAGLLLLALSLCLPGCGDEGEGTPTGPRTGPQALASEGGEGTPHDASPEPTGDEASRPVLGAWYLDPTTIPLPPNRRRPDASYQRVMTVRPDATFSIVSRVGERELPTVGGTWTFDGETLVMTFPAPPPGPDGKPKDPIVHRASLVDETLRIRGPSGARHGEMIWAREPVSAD